MRLFQQVIIVLAVMLGVLLGGPARAQGQFAIVDFQRCAAESKLKKQLDVDLGNLSKTLDGVLDKLKNGNAFFLNAAEIKELATIYEKAQPTDAEKKRMGELQMTADTRAGAAKRLETTAQPTDAQSKELEQLNQMRQDGETALIAVAKGLQDRFQEQLRTVNERLVTEVKTAVTKVAQEKNLGLVFNADVVIYAANDITADVIKLLQK